MSASKYVKAEGLVSVVELSEISNVPSRTLNRMFHDNFIHFKCLVAGAVSIKNKQKCSKCKNRQEHEDIYCICICKYNSDVSRNNTDRSLYEECK